MKLGIPFGLYAILGFRFLILNTSISSGTLFHLYILDGSPESWSIVIALTTLLGLTTIPYGKLADKLSVKHTFTFAGLGWSILYFGCHISPTIFALFFIIPIWLAFWITYNKCLRSIKIT